MGGLKFKIKVPSRGPKKDVGGIQEVEVIVHMVGDDIEKFEKENLALQGTIRDCKLAVQALERTKEDLKKLLEDKTRDTFTPEEATLKGREILLEAKRKARELKEIAMNEAMAVEREISQLRTLKRQMEKSAEPVQIQ